MTTGKELESFELSVDGCKHHACVYGRDAAVDLALWCHAHGYCYFPGQAPGAGAIVLTSTVTPAPATVPAPETPPTWEQLDIFDTMENA